MLVGLQDAQVAAVGDVGGGALPGPPYAGHARLDGRIATGNVLWRSFFADVRARHSERVDQPRPQGGGSAQEVHVDQVQVRRQDSRVHAIMMKRRQREMFGTNEDRQGAVKLLFKHESDSVACIFLLVGVFFLDFLFIVFLHSGEEGLLFFFLLSDGQSAR